MSWPIVIMFLLPFNPGEKVYEGSCTDLAELRESKAVFMCGNVSLFKHLTLGQQQSLASMM